MSIPTDENIKQHIKQQIAFNKDKNVLAKEEINSLQLIEVTPSLVESIRNMDPETELEMIDFLADEALQEFCRVNQYFAFNSYSVTELKSIYSLLNKNIRKLDIHPDQETLNALSQQHYENLCNWLVQTNAFAGEMYSPDQEFAQPVACSEYAPDLQLAIFQIKIENLRKPMLDVGCGREMNLVNFLRDNGLEAYGIDRFENENPYYQKADWLEYSFENEKWGTIISNLGFSNHFIHHNLRADGNYREYAQKYMEILQSLQPNGSFYYAPDLPFIEMHLDKSKYHCTNFAIAGYDFKASQITKIG
ncbi:MAG: class I SAM-dependent methyltransferase [Paludibacter sp.]|nr:class I SAM-dependent methyltransferase [Paludibacter sp.]